MFIDSDPPPIPNDFFEPPMSYSPILSPPLLFDDLLPLFASQSPAIPPHDGSSDADDINSTGHSQAFSPFLHVSSPAVSADESAPCSSTDYHPILNSKFIHSISSAVHCTD